MKKNCSKKLFIATENIGKLNEYIYLLKELNLEILTPKNFPNFNSPDEIGNTFIENALIKARYGFELTKIPTIADDSGLSVEILSGLPGVHSKRFYDNSGDFNKNIEKLLYMLKDVPFENRKAKFIAVVVYKDENHEEIFTGELEGYIFYEKRGEFGFGYDPIFYLPQFSKTVGELTFEEKNKISHRSKAIEKFIIFYKTILQH
ncbi:MAG: RdgB/HAM1 family non-canonical purine NTP pyrophosphatase [Caldisericia bacterium]|nr:RdgB/HAM1 family non-canonical purine NTP pyrophosphatase [Caldisericia bacterium]